MRILCVAEKNDAAKGIANQLSRGGFNRREGCSKFNKNYEFSAAYEGHEAQFIMTSVSGHIHNYAFPVNYKGWNSVSPESLFNAPVNKLITENMNNIKKNLEREVKKCGLLIIWTDCDREGENIGGSVRDICKAAKPNITVKRARFSEITSQAVHNALRNLILLNERVIDAVDVRQELDLRIGASFTRLQSLYLQKKFPELARDIISYGSCQFPTLGFIVERWRAIQDFQAEPFWKIEAQHSRDGVNTIFNWDRGRLFSEDAAKALYEDVMALPTAQVTYIESKPKSKYRPTPLETVEMEKKGRMLNMSAKQIMSVAEKLYIDGYISYPRTETNIFPKSLNLTPLVEHQQQDGRFSQFVGELLQNGLHPRNGKKTDEAHPPIHPLKSGAGLSGEGARLFEFIARRFLATLSRDAKGFETVCRITINDEIFQAKGLVVTDKGYLEVYPYEKWSDKTLPKYQLHERFTLGSIDLNAGSTSAPLLLSESDLIGLMDKYGIGTDATHADHIDKIQTRKYVSLNREKRFLPASLGIGLVSAYDALEIPLAGHQLRSNLERDLVRIEQGEKSKATVLSEQLDAYLEAYRKTDQNLVQFYDILKTYFGEGNNEPVVLPRNSPIDSIAICPACRKPMTVNTTRNGTNVVSCTGFPDCRTSGFLPKGSYLKNRGEPCPNCDGHYKATFHFPVGSVPSNMIGDYQGCVKCDQDLNQIIKIKSSSGPPAGNRANSSHTDRRSPPRNTNNRTNNRPPAGSNQQRKAPNSKKRNSGHFDDDDPSAGGATKIKCQCDKDALGPLTVRKEGPNQGKQFYTCGNDRSCSFFAWQEDALSSSSVTINQPKRTQPAKRPQPTKATKVSATSTPKCLCDQPALQLTVRKEGPNQNRQFFKCGNNSSCNFFEWADSDGNNQTFGNATTDNKKRKAPTCSNCGQIGHTKRGCKNPPK